MECSSSVSEIKLDLTFLGLALFGSLKLALFSKRHKNDGGHLLGNFYDFLQGLKFSYITVIFANIALKRYDFGQPFCVFILKPLRTVCCRFVPLLMTRLVYKCQMCWPPGSHMPAGLFDECSKTLLSLCRLGSMSVWRSHMRPSFIPLADVLRCLQ